MKFANFWEGVRNWFRIPCFNRFCSRKVREPHFLWFGWPEPLLMMMKKIRQRRDKKKRKTIKKMMLSFRPMQLDEKNVQLVPPPRLIAACLLVCCKLASRCWQGRTCSINFIFRTGFLAVVFEAWLVLFSRRCCLFY